MDSDGETLNVEAVFDFDHNKSYIFYPDYYACDVYDFSSDINHTINLTEVIDDINAGRWVTEKGLKKAYWSTDLYEVY